MKRQNNLPAFAAMAKLRSRAYWDSSIALPRAAAAVMAIAMFAGSASAAVKNWAGPDPGTTEAPASGIWDTSSAHWNVGSGAGNVLFENAADGAVFGGADGSYFIQVATSFTATNILFAASGYTLTNDTLSTVTIPANRSLIVADGKTATIGTNVTISGNGNAFFFNRLGATGTLIIEDGGTLEQRVNQPFQIDGGPGSTIRVKTGGRLQLTGNGSNIRLGITANASPEVIVDGGLFTANPGGPSITIGSASGATGTVTILNGTVRNTGTASIRFAESAGSHGTLNLDGGELLVEKIIKANGDSGVLNFNGGTLRAINGNSGAAFMTGLTAANVRNGQSTIDNNGFLITIGQPLVHSTIPGDNAIDGGLIFTGSGLLTLTATNTYTGPTVIADGNLSLGSSGSIDSSSHIRVNSGGTLSMSNRVFFNATGSFTMSDGTVRLNINNFPTNIVTGTFGTEGSFNVIEIPVLVGSGTIPQATPLIKYTTLAPGVVDGNNNLTSLSVVLPDGFNGYLSNNVAKKTIDLVLTAGSLTPQIVVQPVPVTRYAGGTAQFRVTAFGAEGYFWRANGVILDDGGNISGARTSVLTVNNVSTSANYDVVLTNSSGSVASATVSLTVLEPTQYAGTNLMLNPVAYYRLDEMDVNQPAHDYVGGKDGTYLINVFPVPGPTPSVGYVNFEDDNIGIQTAAFFNDAHVVITNGWGINTNTVSLVAWINPVGNQLSFAGLVFNRGGGVTSGLNYSGHETPMGDRTLGYTWNNEGATYNWNSGLVPPQDQWSLVALVITPTNATIYLANLNGIASAVNTHNHVPQFLNGPATIGSDSFNPSDRSFTGYIDEVAVFDRALTRDDITALLTAASGQTSFPPVITGQPQDFTTVYEHQTVQLSAQAFGTEPLSFQWMRGVGGVYSNIENGPTVDGSVFSGAQSSTLVISNIALADGVEYVLVVTNALGEATSSVAFVTVNPVQPPQIITTSQIQSAGLNWNTEGTWSIPGSATALAAEYWGSTFVIQAPGGVRTPDLGNPGSPTSTTFPGEILRVEGNGTYDTTLANAGAIRLKGGNPATFYFKKLVMAGGQISSILNSGWPAIITGELNVISNAVIWASDDTNPRSITIQSTITGDGSIQYHAYSTFTTFQAGANASLNIANPNNPFTGTWFAELGTLVGSAVNALGTNTITVGVQGALQTTYDINNPNADLILNGRMNLTQNDTFGRVFINGNQLSQGTHSAASLAAAYPANFPLTWAGVTGALNSTNISGSITVLDGPAGTVDPGMVLIGNSGGTLQLTWTNASTLLLSATNLAGPWTTNVGATSPFTVTNNAPQKFFRLLGQ